jgi:hypothetical protein
MSVYAAANLRRILETGDGKGQRAKGKRETGDGKGFQI